MPDPLERVLALVAEGRLTAAEAAPILEALDARSSVVAPRSGQAADGGPGEVDRPPRFARIEVTESGRKAVDLRIPLSLGRLAMARIPGLAGSHVDEINEAIALGNKGPIVDIQGDHGDGVRIVLE